MAWKWAGVEAARGSADRMSTVLGVSIDIAATSRDLRDNRGGAPETVAFIASYLFSARTHRNDQWTRSTGRMDEFWTRDDVPGPRFGGAKPIYVLTSSRTFSGGEELADDLQALKRAMIVGETTGGGAHVTATGRIGDHLLLILPIRRAINPITKTNWEGVGVAPDIAMPAEVALDRAQTLLRERLESPR